MQLVNHNVRTKLDELKRKEIERLRQLITRKVKLNNRKSPSIRESWTIERDGSSCLFRCVIFLVQPEEIEKLLPKHVDHSNLETFEVNDLEKLIRQATNDLEEVDKLRREEFKQHELEKEYERRVNLEVSLHFCFRVGSLVSILMISCNLTKAHGSGRPQERRTTT